MKPSQPHQGDFVFSASVPTGTVNAEIGKLPHTKLTL
jgi:hypothetical protein